MQILEQDNQQFHRDHHRYVAQATNITYDTAIDMPQVNNNNNNNK